MGTQQTTETLAETTATPAELEALARKVYDAFNARKLDDAATLVADECEWVDVPSGSGFKGRSGFLDFVNGWLTAFPDARIEIKNVVCQGDVVVTEFAGRGTHSGPLARPEGEVAATGREAEIRCMELLQFRGKKIVRARTYYDAMSVLRQLRASERA